MSEILLVIPPDWIEIPAYWIGTVNSEWEVNYWLEQGDWVSLESRVMELIDVPIGKHVVDARMILLEAGYRMWVLLG